MKQPADYFKGSSGLSMELQTGWDLDLTIAIIPITAYVPPNLCWPVPARPLLPRHSGVQLSLLPSPALALQFVQALARATQIMSQLSFYCL